MKLVTVLISAFLVLAMIGGTVGCGGGEEATPTSTPADGADATPTPEPILLKQITASPGTSSEAYYLFGELVEKYTDGRVQIDFYPGSQLFPGTEQWEALATGSVDILTDATFWFRDAVPDILVFYLDATWESYDHAYAVLEESELISILEEKMAEAAPAKLLGIFPRSMTMCLLNTVKETRHFKDLKGLKTQGQPGYPSSPLYDFVGMASVPLSVEEVTAAFIQGVIDAVNYPPSTMLDLGLAEPAKHALFYNSIFITTGIVMNSDSWESLPADIRDIIANKVMPEVYEFSKRISQEADTAAIAEVEQLVETAHWATEEDYAAFYEYVPTHSLFKVQTLMIDPEIMQIVDDYRPSKQQQ
jgi:TRAP-type C4-dicarboxylate transport system substrate-binding protein